MKRAHVNNFSVKWVEAQIYKASKLAFSNINRSRYRLRPSPRRRCAGVATVLLKHQEHSLKKTGKIDTVLISVLHIQNHNVSTSRTQK